MPARRKDITERNAKVNKAVGNLVKEVRAKAGLSQIAMSEILDMEQTTLSRVEAGRRELGVKSWLLLKKHFKNQLNEREVERLLIIVLCICPQTKNALGHLE